MRCPHHPSGGCSLARHGTYARKTPPGTRIARWYCPESHTTFSLLPDCLAARLPGTLAELEDAVAAVERSPSVAAAAALRAGRSEPPGAMRWLRRRIRLVRRALTTVRGLLPERLAGCPPTILAFRGRLGTDAGAHLAARDGRAAASPRCRRRSDTPTTLQPVGVPIRRSNNGWVMTRRAPDPNVHLIRPPTAAKRHTHMARTLDDDTRQAVALFRYGLIADLVNLPPGRPASARDCAPRPGRTTSSPAPCVPASPPRPCATGSPFTARAASTLSIRSTAATAAAPAACRRTSPNC